MHHVHIVYIYICLKQQEHKMGNVVIQMYYMNLNLKCTSNYFTKSKIKRMLLIQKRILLDLQYCYGNVTDIIKDSMHKLSQILN